MKRPGFLLSLALLLAVVAGPACALTAEDVNEAVFKEEKRADAGKPDPFIVKAQVLLSRRSISPGEVDGIDGENYRKAIAQFRRQEKLGDGDELDEAAWRVLSGEEGARIVKEYVLSKEDVPKDFPDRIPDDYAKQAKMKRLFYTSAEEMHAERFHMSEKLLRALNPDANYDKAGEKILIVAVERQPPEAKVERLEAVKGTGMLIVYGPGDKILASYPATIGSDDNPSLEGEYKIERIVRDPPYHYDPEKNFQQGRNTEKLVLPPGPNGPVGTVWIALSKPTFGIHGTPEPAKVSKSSSHGCVRLTNWDVDELADMVKPGVPVRFVP